METRASTVFKLGAMVTINTYGLLLVVPVLSSVLLMSLMPIGFVPLALPFLGLLISATILPLGMGNPHVIRLVRRRLHVQELGSAQFIVQTTLTPRGRGGLRGLFEDADDIGVLTVESGKVSFEGDSLRLVLPFSAIEAASTRNVGWRGVFVYGQRLAIIMKPGQTSFTEVEFSERSSRWLPESKRTTRAMQRAVEEALRKSVASGAATSVDAQQS